MCTMEVRAGQRSSTIAQAMAHNVETVRGDIKMFREVLERRGENERIVALNRAAENLDRAYADFLELFGEFVAEEEAERGQHFSEHEQPGDDGTNERVHEDLGRIGHTHGDHRPNEDALAEEAKRDTRDAKPYEAR